MTSHKESPQPPLVQPESLLEAANNVSISLLINRAHLAVQNLQYEAARTLLGNAINLTGKLLDPTVPQARCYYWQGVIVDKTGREDLAPQMFVRAMPCKDCSREGDHLLPYIQK